MLGAGPVAAQDSAAAGPDSLPFRRGQWAAQFQGGGDFASLGALRFSSPRGAWVVDGRVAASADRFRDGYIAQTSDGQPVDVRSDHRGAGASLGVRVGRRAYSPAGRSVHVFRGAGLSAGVLRSESQTLGDPRTYRYWGWDGGVFAEVGAAYRVTPRISLGALGGVAASYEAFVGNYDSLRGRAIRLSASVPSFNATIHF